MTEDDDFDGPDSNEPATDRNHWVIPVPSADQPQFAVLPWSTYRKLVEIAGLAMRTKTNVEPVPGLDLPDNVARLPYGQRPERQQIRNAGRPTPTGLPEPGTVERPALNIWGGDDDAYENFGETTDDDPYPLDVMERLLDGEHPVKVFRRYRGLTQKELADLTGLNPTYLSQIETRKRGGSTRVYRRLAAALSIDIGNLID